MTSASRFVQVGTRCSKKQRSPGSTSSNGGEPLLLSAFRAVVTVTGLAPRDGSHKNVPMPRVQPRVGVTLIVCAGVTVAWTYVAAGQVSQQKRSSAVSTSAAGDWPTYGHDRGGMRFS